MFLNSRLLSLSVLLSITLTSVGQLTYPKSQPTQQTDQYFGTSVSDPYRWLENMGSEETLDWIKQQNTFTEAYLEQIPFRNAIRKRLAAIQNFTRYEHPFINGGYYYYFKNDGLQDQDVLYRQKGLNGTPEVFLDPNSFSEDGSVSLTEISFSEDGNNCAYSISKKGSDWNEAFMFDTKTKARSVEKLEWLKFSPLSWYKNEGFYYSRFPAPNASQLASGQNQYHSVYYHQAGTSQHNDELVYTDTLHPARYHFATVTPDNQFLVMYVMDGTEGVQIMLQDLGSKKRKPFKMILQGFEHDATLVDNDNKYLYLRTNVSAPNYRVVAASVTNPFVNNYETLIPETADLLQDAKRIGDDWFGVYLHNVSSQLVQFRPGGYKVKEIDVPSPGSITLYEGKPGDREMFYSFQSFSQPAVLYRYDIHRQKSELFKELRLSFDPNAYETKQVFYTNRDMVKIPMFIGYKKGIELHNDNPLLLHAYGGFNRAEMPVFNPANLLFMDQGGVYVVANIRGGSEFGEKWHKAGMLFGKQNVFNDFIDAAKFLIAEKYTSPSKLAIHGWSNGGLLVGACITQKPELFKVALPDAGVLDMLRYQKFTVGAGWIPEFGSSDDPAHFDNLYTYSPLHNVKPGRQYPATFITAARHDDRVVPLHSYKFAARLQECQGSNNPVLIRIGEGAAHSEGKPISQLLGEMTDVMSFTMYHLGMTFR